MDLERWQINLRHAILNLIHSIRTRYTYTGSNAHGIYIQIGCALESAAVRYSQKLGMLNFKIVTLNIAVKKV